MQVHLRRTDTRFLLLIAAFLLLALGFSITVPLGEAPDEVSHFSYIAYLTDHGTLPTPQGAAAGEAHQPPLYYLIGALSTFWIPKGDWEVIANPDFVLGDPQTPNLLLHTRAEAFPYTESALAWHLIRVLSIAMGALTVWATWRVAVLLFPGNEWLAIGAAGFVAFLPEFIFISSMVNNDNLIIMLSSLAILQVNRISLRRSMSRVDAVSLGCLLGLAGLTKLSGFVLFPFVAVIMLFQMLNPASRRTTIIRFVQCFGIAGIIVTPWLFYNWVAYSDLLANPLLLAIVPQRLTPMNLQDWLVFTGGLYRSFWARFGGAMQIGPPDILLAVLAAIPIISVYGWFLYSRDWSLRRIDPGAKKLLVLFGLFWAFMLVAYLRWILTLLGTDQARQLFSGLLLLSIFVTCGIMRVLSGREKYVAGALCGGGFVLSLGMLLFLANLYSPPPAYAGLDRGINSMDFGQTIRLVDYQVSSASIAPGSPITIQAEWQSLKETTRDYWLLIQLVGPSGSIAEKEGVPSAGRLTTDWWRVGQVESSHHSLVVPTDALPGTYTLVMGLHPFRGHEWLRVNGRDKLELGEIIVTGKPGD